nr:MAG TPA: hypothetical protein [Caudoviricetes sp.]
MLRLRLLASLSLLKWALCYLATPQNPAPFYRPR